MMSTERRARLFLLAVVALGCAVGGKKTSIVDTEHNLSVTGPGEIKSATETRVCVFCHSSHDASSDGPLWNHRSTTPGKFRTYERSTMAGRPEQPNGATKLCLSCHDGTVAVGAVRGHTGDIAMLNVGPGGEIPSGRPGHIGTDLTGTHPVSIRFTQSLALADPHLRWPPASVEGNPATDADGYVQCTSCHDAHGSRSDRYPFWRKETFGQVCKECHAY